MKRLYKIIKEECVKFLREVYDDDDITYSYFEKKDEIKDNLLGDFLYHNNPDFTKHVPWRVIPYPRLKKIWEDYMRYNFVRDEQGLDMIVNLMINNTTKVAIFTELAGHTSSNPDDDYEEYFGRFIDDQLTCIFEKPIDKNQLKIPFNDPKKGYEKPTETSECNTTIYPYIKEFIEEKYNPENMDLSDIRGMLMDELTGKFFDYYMNDPDGKMGGFISDYGLRPLEELLSELLRAKEDSEKVMLVDRMLNVVHQRSDIASWFVEGGSRALAQLSGSPSEVE
jgi:hypothetical protein